MVIINTRASLRPSTKSWRWPWGSSKPKRYHTRTFDTGGVPGEGLQETGHVGQILQTARQPGKFFGDASVRQLGDTRVERWMVRKRVCQPHQDLARNANTSTLVGNQVSDVLQEVNFDSTKEGQQYFEPKHCQYLQVRQPEYEVMEIALDDLNEVPVKLGPGVTSVVLHFRHRNSDDDV